MNRKFSTQSGFNEDLIGIDIDNIENTAEEMDKMET